MSTWRRHVYKTKCYIFLFVNPVSCFCVNKNKTGQTALLLSLLSWQSAPGSLLQVFVCSCCVMAELIEHHIVSSGLRLQPRPAFMVPSQLWSLPMLQFERCTDNKSDGPGVMVWVMISKTISHFDSSDHNSFLFSPESITNELREDSSISGSSLYTVWRAIQYCFSNYHFTLSEFFWKQDCKILPHFWSLWHTS